MKSKEGERSFCKRRSTWSLCSTDKEPGAVPGVSAVLGMGQSVSV